MVFKPTNTERGYNGLIDVGYSKHLRMDHGMMSLSAIPPTSMVLAVCHTLI